MGVKDRLDLIIRELGVSGRQFARACGFSESYYPTINDGIGADKLNKIISVYPQISARWLITGEGAMFSEVNAPQPSRSDASAFIDYLKEKDAKIEELLKELTKYKTLYEEHPNENAGGASRAVSRAVGGE